jgi:6-pyruvoyltetrahydropterin/6-carboxytetrahydropterin synthase
MAEAGRAYFGRRTTMSASHRLHADALSAEENQAVYGKCNNAQGHGHNYVVEVLVSGTVNAETGMVVNLAVLDDVLNKKIIQRFDHTNLNLDPAFSNRVPTTENLTKVVFELLDGSIEGAELVKVRVEETENNFFEYSGK